MKVAVKATKTSPIVRGRAISGLKRRPAPTYLRHASAKDRNAGMTMKRAHQFWRWMLLPLTFCTSNATPTTMRMTATNQLE